MDRAASLTSMFNLIDVSQSGSLDRAELSAAFGIHSEEFLSHLDDNHDQKLSCDEFVAGIADFCKHLSDEEFQAQWLDRMAETIAGSATVSWEEVHCEGEVPSTRSSHSFSFNPADGMVYLWGGEHEARTPIDSKREG
eukprot:TRINITY_DN12242_c0_g1_i8.p3 TRINITY_DN12242_c0_g1~~TRINITY_DN12242_c0_g1_i8.p3  ORF type:complete len:138 (+),score=36.33 TRINITY_DN12242_c0_g1_i8:220-633(+)